MSGFASLYIDIKLAEAPSAPWGLSVWRLTEDDAQDEHASDAKADAGLTQTYQKPNIFEINLKMLLLLLLLLLLLCYF